MGIALGLCAAVTYGAADFIGGLVSRRDHVFRVVFLSQAVGLLILVCLLPIVENEPATVRALFWGAAAGVGGGGGVVLLYRGLAVGRMSVVAPVTAVLAATVPVFVGLATGERPSVLALGGVLVALGAVALVSAPAPAGDESTEGVQSGLPEALGAGASFGAFFVLLDRAGTDTGMWPLLGTKSTSMVLVGVLLLATRTSIKPGASVARPIVAAGILDMGANVLYLLAVRRGLLSLVAVATSMYPATTVLLARVVLRERMLRLQVAGIGLALVGIALITLG